MFMDPAGITVGIISIGIAILIIRYAKSEAAKVDESKRWPLVKGEITYSDTETREMGGGAAGYGPRIEYTYTVHGKEFKSNDIYFGGIRFLSSDSFSLKEDAEEICKKYPEGASVDVYYNPRNPGTAVLERRMVEDFMAIVYVVAGIFIFLGLLIAYAFME